MNKANRNQWIGIAICAGLQLGAWVWDCRRNPQVGDSGYLKFCESMKHSPFSLELEALAILAAGLWAISLLFKNRHRFWTYWIIHVFIGLEYSTLYLIYLAVLKYIHPKMKKQPVLSTPPTGV